MTFANPDDEREVPSLPPRHIAGPVVISLVVHGAVLMLLARMTMSDAAPDAAELPAISVALVTRAQPRLPLPPPRAPQVVPEPQAEPEAPRPDVPSEPEEADAEVADVPIAEPAEFAPESDEVPEAAVENSRAADRSVDADANAQPWTPARIRAALDTSRREQQRETTATWLTECLVEQKQHGTRDCTRQQQPLDHASDSGRAGRAAGENAFAVVTGPQRRARLSERFRRDNLRLAELMDEEGEAGLLATQRYYINLEYFRYLNGNGQAPLFSAMQNFRADVLGGSALSLPGNVPFTCSKRRTSFAIGEKGKATGVPTPCLYEWTGFTIERPETTEADAFRVVPVVPRGDLSEPAIPVTP